MAQSNVRFLHAHLTDEQLVGYYQRCRAFVFRGDEDFGIAAVEAQACGKPVIAYGSSGVAETVIDGKTGILFYEQTPQALMNAYGSLLHGRMILMIFEATQCHLVRIRFKK